MVATRPVLTSQAGGGPLTPAPDIFSAVPPPTNGIKPVPRQSPRKSSSSRIYPTPRSMSPSISRSPARLSSILDTLQHPPSFAPTSRHANGQYTPYSPYRPGEYQRTERVAPTERTKIERKVERKLFDDDEDELSSTPRNEMSSSSPLAPAFEAKMKLRNGACIDIVSWLRTNFHWRHEQTAMTPSHTDVNPSMSALQVRRLVSERFSRVIEVKEILHAVTTAFPKSEWKYPDNENPNGEPPIMHGLTWHGRDIAEEEDLEATPTKSRPHPNSSAAKTRATLTADIGAARATAAAAPTSRSPTQSTLMSPISSSTRRALPDTPATRSVLEEFAEIATQSERTPLGKNESLPLGGGDLSRIYGPQSSFAEFASEFDTSRKRRASASPPDPNRRRRASTPDKLHGLVAAAEALEGSPLNTVLQRGHKRRRTIANPREIMSDSSVASVESQSNSGVRGNGNGYANRYHRTRGTASPRMPQGSGYLPNVNEEVDALLSIGTPDVRSSASPPVSEVSHASNILTAPTWPMRAATSSSASHLSTISGSLPVTTAGGPSSSASSAIPVQSNVNAVLNDPLVPPRPQAGGRKVNELPSASQGLHPGYDCKPPHPYHEMIRDAIESNPERKLQLAQIYSTIADKYPFFKTLDEKKTAGWQNSIRHNLSLKKMFVRVNKGDGTPDDSGGKGGWWTVDPEIPDEGRPGRKAKSRKKNGSSSGNGAGSTAEASEVDGSEERQEVTPTQISGRGESNGQNGHLIGDENDVVVGKAEMM